MTSKTRPSCSAISNTTRHPSDYVDRDELIAFHNIRDSSRWHSGLFSLGEWYRFVQLSPMKSLVVSLHAVSPLTRTLCESILAQLQELGIRQTSLLVIPN